MRARGGAARRPRRLRRRRPPAPPTRRPLPRPRTRRGRRPHLDRRLNMSTTDPARSTVRQYRTREPTSYDGEGTGWMLFAAVMLAIVAALNFIDGVAAVSNSKFYVRSAEFVFADLKT